MGDEREPTWRVSSQLRSKARELRRNSTDAERILWSELRDHRLHRSNATVGIKSVERVEIVDGLNAGDLVLISPLGKMADGQAVRTELIDPRTAALQNRPDV